MTEILLYELCLIIAASLVRLGYVYAALHLGRKCRLREHRAYMEGFARCREATERDVEEAFKDGWAYRQRKMGGQ